MSVLVVTGAGGMGLAIARRLGTGRHTLLTDVHADRADEVADLLRSDGHAVTSAAADVSDASSVEALVKSAGELGPLGAVVHTAGVSPIQADAETIMAVDLVGTARVLDRFETIATNGSVAVVIASMAGHYWPELDDADHRQLATSPADELVSVSIVARAASGGRAAAYALAKRANQVRVQHAALRWASRGGRCVSVSPGIISTPMGQQELAGFGGDVMRSMIDRSPARRIGTPDDIAAAVEFLVSPAASFITGTDLLVDGGVVASTKAAGSP